MGRGSARLDTLAPNDEAQAAAVRHGLPGVDAEIHQSAVDLGRRGIDPQRTVEQIRRDLDGGGERGAKKADDRANVVAEVDAATLGILATPEDLDLLNELLASNRGLDELLDRLESGVLVAQIELGELGVGETDRKDVVEVVRDAAGEPAERVEALGLVDLGFESLALAPLLLLASDVGQRADDL